MVYLDAMYAELCAYLTSDRYFRLPTDDVRSFEIVLDKYI